MLLTKSKFIAGEQCLKRLYLQVHEPELAAEPDAAAGAIIEQGREVGLLARKLFPGGIEVDGYAGLKQAIRTTKQLIANPEIPAIFEAAFEHEGIVIKTDVLQRRKKNLWRLVEVKSASDVKDHHVQDLAIQSYVLSRSGLKLASVWLVHINRAYVLTGTTVDPRQLFSFRNLTERAQNFHPELILRLRSQFQVLATPEAPDVPTGLHCINPVVCGALKRQDTSLLVRNRDGSRSGLCDSLTPLAGFACKYSQSTAVLKILLSRLRRCREVFQENCCLVILSVTNPCTCCRRMLHKGKSPKTGNR